MKNLLARFGWAIPIIVGTAILTAAGVAIGSRNGSGTYTLPTPGVPFQSGTPISSSQMNNTFTDLQTEMTDSLSRSGKGGMTAALRVADGSVGTPAYSWTNDTNSGEYRIGAQDIGWSLSSVKKLELTSALFTVVPAASFSSTVTVTSLVGANAPASTLGAGLTVKGVATTNATLTTFTQTVSNNAAAFEGTKVNDQFLPGLVWYTSDDNATKPKASINVKTGTAGSSISFGTTNNYATGVTANTTIDQTGMITAPGGVTIGTSVAADGSGFKHKRVSGCTTAAAAGATCNVTLTWGTTFADANYTAVCNIDGSSGPAAMVGISGKIAASMLVVITAVTAVAATATNFDCIAVHD
jgi:hypothetical protein